MNVKLTALSTVLALLAAAPVYAEQASGRSSVYAAPGATTAPRAKVENPVNGNRRGSVYARDLPAPTPRDRVHAVITKPGRA
jgi:hypothetical protein